MFIRFPFHVSLSLLFPLFPPSVFLHGAATFLGAFDLQLTAWRAPSNGSTFYVLSTVSNFVLLK